MKTKVLGIFIATFFIVGLFGTTAITLAYDSNNPFEVDLIAGQHIDAGVVQVWNDDTNLYIRIVGDGWEIIDTHVAVEGSWMEIPQTKKGNPIPGKFPYKGELSYVIPLSEINSDGTGTHIAVHAVVRGTGENCGQEETAWAYRCGGEFPGKNWATYFWYDYQGWVYKETVEVPANTITPTESLMTLLAGENYKLVATGTASAGDSIEFDAKYSIKTNVVGDTWTDSVTNYESYGPTLLDLFVDGVSPDWGAYNEGHEYSVTIAGTGSKLSLNIYDTYPSNNAGSILVDIYEWA